MDASDRDDGGMEDAMSSAAALDATPPNQEAASGRDADQEPNSADADAGQPLGPVSCDQGSELSDAGTCVDLDECARDLDDCDDVPSACINLEGGAGFSCACPTGYRGDGRGTDGCTDIDECAEQVDTCDALAPCNNSSGSYSCGDCPAGYAAGALGECSDIDECNSSNGGCDTNPLAECLNREGMPNACRCPAGYAGNGVGNQGCVDPCSTASCGPGLVCTRTPSGTANCTGACAANGCQPGDVCATDADCQTGGDSSATCEPSAKVCVRVCPAATVVSQASLDALRYCKEINGDLKIEPNFATIDASALPYLERVRGSLTALGGISGILFVESITIPNLQTVDGPVHFSALPLLKVLSMPRLRTAGELGVTTNSSLTQVSLPQLISVSTNFSLFLNRALERVDIGRLGAVGQQLSLGPLCRLPWTQVQPISALGTNQEISGIGCCNMSTDKFACPGQCMCN